MIIWLKNRSTIRYRIFTLRYAKPAWVSDPGKGKVVSPPDPSSESSSEILSEPDADAYDALRFTPNMMN